MDLAGGFSVFPCSLIYLRVLLKGLLSRVFPLKCAHFQSIFVGNKLTLVIHYREINSNNSITCISTISLAFKSSI